MIVPRYWAEATTRIGSRWRQATLRRCGWSDASQDAAQFHAEALLAEAASQLKRGEAPLRREHKVAHGGIDGLPIREEIVDRCGTAGE